VVQVVRLAIEDLQDDDALAAGLREEVMRQREQAGALVRCHGVIVAEFFDAGQSRTVAWGRRPEAARLVAQLADPRRGWDAVVVGEYERAFYGSQYAAMEHCLHLPDAMGVVKLDRRQSEARSEEFIKAWEAARLPDDADGFRVCGEVVP
jgi:hypothetical protein